MSWRTLSLQKEHDKVVLRYGILSQNYGKGGMLCSKEALTNALASTVITLQNSSKMCPGEALVLLVNMKVVRSL